MKKSLTLIKLGGSIITDKAKENTLRPEVLTRLVKEIAQAREENSTQRFIVGHGQGSFAHVPAAKYGTIQGFQNEESRLGMAIVLDSVGHLNRIVVRSFIDANVPAVSFFGSNTIVTTKRAAESFSLDVLEQYLLQELFPVTCGDVLVDSAQGCTIWSTEEILSLFARELPKKGWKIDRVIHVVEVDGFYDTSKKVVKEITAETWPILKEALVTTKGTDVTGGMGLKVEESLALAKLGIPSYIISGLKKDNLYNILTGKSWLGTRII